MGTASAETATMVTAGAAATGTKAAAEAKSVTDGEPCGKRPKPAIWGEHDKGPTHQRN